MNVKLYTAAGYAAGACIAIGVELHLHIQNNWQVGFPLAVGISVIGGLIGRIAGGVNARR